MLFRAFVLSIFLHLAILGGLRDFDPLTRAVVIGSKQLINVSLSSAVQGRSVIDKAVTAQNYLTDAQSFRRKRLAGKESGALSASSSSTQPFVEAATAESPGKLLEDSRAVSVKSLSDDSADSAASDGIRQYRLNLAREARRYKRYPAIARERAWQGEVVVDLSTLHGLSTPVVSLSQSSGYAVLDAQAVEMVENAARQTPVPESLRGKRLVISLPIHYRLDD